jgi:hypothetical protein
MTWGVLHGKGINEGGLHCIAWREKSEPGGVARVLASRIPERADFVSPFNGAEANS